jgi:hypothetical protein
MPNWCNNVLEISHEDPAMIERAREAFNDGRLLDEFIPVPQELRDAVANHSTNEELVAKYGYSDWYGFCVANWGTKWDVGGDGMEAEDLEPEFPGIGLRLVFDSAWAPPIQAYQALEEMGFKVRAMYYESGMCFAGIYEDDSDDYYELSDMTADEVAEELPEELDEMFCISENMAEWEEDNKENEDE